MKDAMMRAAFAFGTLAAAAAVFAGEPSSDDYTVLGKLYVPKGAYVDTLLKPSNDWCVTMDVDVQGTGEYWFGVWDTDYKTGAYAICNDGSSVYGGYGNDGGGFGSVVSTGRHVIKLDGNVYSLDGVETKTFGEYTFTLNNNLYLFAQNRCGSAVGLHSDQQTMVFYSCTISQNGTALRDFVPVTRKSDKVPGLYDKVSDSFFASASSTAFLAREAAVWTAGDGYTGTIAIPDGESDLILTALPSASSGIGSGKESTSTANVLTDGYVPALKPANAECYGKTCFYDANSSITYSFSAAATVYEVRLYSLWPDTGRDEINVSSVICTLSDGTQTTIGDAASNNSGSSCMLSLQLKQEDGSAMCDDVRAVTINFGSCENGYCGLTEIEIVGTGGVSESEVKFGSLSASYADGKATLTADVVREGDGTAQLYAVWDYSDAGTTLSAWGDNKVSVGSVSDFKQNGAVLEDLPEHSTVVMRVFAVAGEEEYCTSAVSLFTLELRAENQPLSGNSETDFTVDGDAVGYEEKDVSVKKLILKNGSYVFPGKKTISVYDGALFDNIYGRFDNQIANKSDNVTFAFTNTFVQYQGLNNYNKTNPFSTGSGKNGVKVEMINTTGRAEGMVWDCMKQGIKIGVNASDCSLVVDGRNVTSGAVISNMIYNTTGFHLAEGAGSSRNHVILRGGALVRDEITVSNAYNNFGDGADANDNVLEILGGEGFVTELYKGYGGVIGRGACSGNKVVVDGKGVAGSAYFDCRQGFTVGSGGAVSNELEVINGGVVSGPTLQIGLASFSNTVTVSGTGSVLQGSGGSTALTIGSGGSNSSAEGNRLIVEKGGSVSNFSKWSTLIGGHEQNNMTGTTKNNGLIIRSGGTFTLPNSMYIGRIKGAGSIAKGNYCLVEGTNATLNASGKDIFVGVASLSTSAGAGAEVCENRLEVKDGGKVTALRVRAGNESSETTPGACHDNVVLVTAGGYVVATETMYAGLADDAERSAEEAVSVNNSIIAEKGGILKASNMRTVSGNGCRIVMRDGGVFQTASEQPKIYPYEDGSIMISNGVVSCENTGCCPTIVETSTAENSWQSIKFAGKNAFRLTACQTRNWGNPYTFGDTEPDNPRHFVRLEMMDGTTAWRGDTKNQLLIDATGSMLCSNTTATIGVPFTLSGPLAICNSSLSFTQPATLDATITIPAETIDDEADEPSLVLSEDTTLGENLKIVVTGEVEEGLPIYRGASTQRIDVELPDGYGIARQAQSDGSVLYVTAKKQAFRVIIR